MARDDVILLYVIIRTKRYGGNCNAYYQFPSRGVAVTLPTIFRHAQPVVVVSRVARIVRGAVIIVQI